MIKLNNDSKLLVMSNEIDNLDRMLECAIREKWAVEHMKELDRREKIRRRRYVRSWAFGVAASFAIVIGIDAKLSHDARTAGYTFDPTFGQMGGSEITALMQERNIDEAVRQIDIARVRIDKEIADPASSDPDYLLQLESDRQELDLLDAVCLMREGKYFKARKALKAIVEEGGAYKAEAQKLLGEL